MSWLRRKPTSDIFFYQNPFFFLNFRFYISRKIQSKKIVWKNIYRSEVMGFRSSLSYPSIMAPENFRRQLLETGLTATWSVFAWTDSNMLSSQTELIFSVTNNTSFSEIPSAAICFLTVITVAGIVVMHCCWHAKPICLLCASILSAIPPSTPSQFIIHPRPVFFLFLFEKEME